MVNLSTVNKIMFKEHGVCPMLSLTLFDSGLTQLNRPAHVNPSAGLMPTEARRLS